MSTLAKAGDVAAWTPEQKELIKRTVAKDASDDELRMFLHVASVSGLDPLLKQIHFTKMGGRIAFIADVNGLQARASKAPDFEGISCAVVYEKDDFAMDQKTGEVVRHVNNPFAQAGKPVGAWAVVRRAGKLPFVSCVRFVEYFNPNNPLWKPDAKPSVMILKCAKSTALRLAYPERFGSVYDEAELGKEERELNPAPDPTPQATHAAAVKKQLAARLKVVDVQPGETEAEATAREAAPAASAGPGIWEQMEIACDEYGVDRKHLGQLVKACCPTRTSKSELDASDLAKVKLQIAATAKPPEAPPSDVPF